MGSGNLRAVTKARFHPIVQLPAGTPVFDLSKGYDPEHGYSYGIGRYDEKRVGMYAGELFAGGEDAERRDIHVGIDLGAPAGTEVFAFDDGEIFLFGDNAGPGDYGPTLITRHELDGRSLWVLLGHLSRESLIGKRRGDRFVVNQRDHPPPTSRTRELRTKCPHLTRGAAHLFNLLR